MAKRSHIGINKQVLIVLKNIFNFLFKQKEHVLTFSELMIQVDKAEDVEELEEAFEYFVENQHHYSVIQQNFAKEHLKEKVIQVKNSYLEQIKLINNE